MVINFIYDGGIRRVTSEERHEARYQRRITNRKNKKKAKLSRLGNYDSIFSYESLYDAFYLCEKGVRWKASVQTYEATLALSTLSIYKIMHKRKFKPMGFLEFDLTERGKKRHIRALKLSERCIQRTLCDNYLNPIIQDTLIYDNGASIQGKGIDFTLSRLKLHLSQYYRKYHTNEGYIFQYDFSSFFNNIDHDILLGQLKEVIPDKEIYDVLEQMTRCFGKKGLGLGSQVSQTAAIFYPTPIDKYFKEVLHKKWYGRYMDDGYVICHTLEEVEECKAALKMMCDKLNITLNERKINVSKISKTFVFLKKRFFVTETGHIVVKIGKDSVVRARRRLKKLVRKTFDKSDNVNFAHLYQYYKSWVGMAKRYDNYHILQSYRKLFLQLVAHYNDNIERTEESCLISEHMDVLLPT